MNRLRPRVLVHDPSPTGTYVVERSIIDEAGAELIVPFSNEERDDLLPTADVVIVTGHQNFSAQHAELASRCVGIQTASTGTDRVTPIMAERGVAVRSAAGYCTAEVADHAMALLLCLERHLYAVDRANRAGKPRNSVPQIATIHRLNTRVLGILGFGRIGQQVALRALAFGYRVLAYDPYADSEHNIDVELVDMPTLLSLSTTVMSCVPLTAETAYLLDGDAFEQMQDGVHIVNVSRGGVLCEADLVRALDSGKVSCAALDVRETEPPSQPDPLSDRDDVILTHHMSATSIEAVEELFATVGTGAVALLREANLIPVVNSPI